MESEKMPKKDVRSLRARTGILVGSLGAFHTWPAGTRAHSESDEGSAEFNAVPLQPFRACKPYLRGNQLIPKGNRVGVGGWSDGSKKGKESALATVSTKQVTLQKTIAAIGGNLEANSFSDS